MYDLCMFIRYLVSETHVLKDIQFGLDNRWEYGNLLLLLLFMAQHSDPYIATGYYRLIAKPSVSVNVL
jgi:hypothetical protein